MIFYVEKRKREKKNLRCLDADSNELRGPSESRKKFSNSPVQMVLSMVACQMSIGKGTLDSGIIVVRACQ